MIPEYRVPAGFRYKNKHKTSSWFGEMHEIVKGAGTRKVDSDWPETKTGWAARRRAFEGAGGAYKRQENKRKSLLNQGYRYESRLTGMIAGRLSHDQSCDDRGKDRRETRPPVNKLQVKEIGGEKKGGGGKTEKKALYKDIMPNQQRKTDSGRIGPYLLFVRYRQRTTPRQQGKFKRIIEEEYLPHYPYHAHRR